MEKFYRLNLTAKKKDANAGTISLINARYIR